MVCTEHAEAAAVSCGTSHVTIISTPLSLILKARHKMLVTLVKSHASTVSVLDSGEQHYIYIYRSNQQQESFLDFKVMIWVFHFPILNTYIPLCPQCEPILPYREVCCLQRRRKMYYYYHSINVSSRCGIIQAFSHQTHMCGSSLKLSCSKYKF